MRKQPAAFILTSLALTLAAGGASAQVGSAARPVTSPTNGSTITATTSGAAMTGTSTNATVPVETQAGTNVSASVPSSSTPASTSSSTGISNPAVTTTSEGTPSTTGTNTLQGGLAPGVVLPGVVTTMDSGVNANGERIVGSNTAPPVENVNTNPAVTPTPLFELTARQGLAREAQRRARGEEPRVYGIAPRTERDLTHQMPDDPIIRY